MRYIESMDRRKKEPLWKWTKRVEDRKQELQKQLPGAKVIVVVLDDAAYFWREV